MVAATSSASGSLKEYLKRYESKSEEEKKKKKKKKKAKPDALGVLVVDEDPVWQKPVKVDEDENDDSADEEKPVVDEDIEVKRMKRLEQLRLRRPFGAISEDGSGWVSVSDTPNPLNSNEQNSDISPPRKRRIWNGTPSPEPNLKPSRGGREVTDLSPPRQMRRRHHTPSPEPETKASHSLGSGSKRLTSKNQSSDISPPRKQRARYETHSPEPNLRSLKSEREVTDLSPVRRRHRHHSTSSPEPEMKQLLSSGPDPDFSPPRRPRRQESSHYGEKNSEISKSRDISPPRRVRRSSLHQDVSQASPGADLSPPRKGRVGRPGSCDLSLRPSSRLSTETDVSLVSSVSGLSSPKNIRKGSSALKEQPITGLVTGQDIKEENARTKKTDWERFKDMDPSISGRGAEPVYRDKATGARISKDELMKLTKKDEKPKEIKLEWGKGLAQKREAETRQQELELEMDKPFARTRDDPELDKMLKERLRWGDPMAHLVKRKHSELVLPDLGENEKMKESGFIIPQDIPSHSWLKRGLDAAPNRYGIKPGRHWDGVDRSNGFEKQMFKRTNEKQATEKEAYLWSVSDM
ncbi:uncharacterized protein LOC130766024 isoform X2 [Actinidia eriantha]|nr:uncharacterized protein LOC130766024 isoform X2 [Actinidia eriantha]XP_057478675.1 uncharacterized protein LOC130766024 isoform X2 [Actinidia eriantha]